MQHIGYKTLAGELWLVVPFYWLIRLGHIWIWGIGAFTNWKYEIFSFGLSVFLAGITQLWIIRPLLDVGENIFIAPTTFRDGFWIAALSYIAKQIWDVSKSILLGRQVFPEEKRAKTIQKRYDYFKWKYNAQIEKEIRDKYHFQSSIKQNEFLYIFYSIMIYEDHCRPPFVRACEYAMKFLLWKREMSLGVMQVKTSKLISSRTSINLALDRLYQAYNNCDGADKVYWTAFSYNPSHSYAVEVCAIHTELVKMLVA